MPWVFCLELCNMGDNGSRHTNFRLYIWKEKCVFDFRINTLSTIFQLSTSFILSSENFLPSHPPSICFCFLPFCSLPSCLLPYFHVSTLFSYYIRRFYIIIIAHQSSWSSNYNFSIQKVEGFIWKIINIICFCSMQQKSGKKEKKRGKHPQKLRWEF